ncbi:Ig-like domain-containing protein [Azoarcus sp. DN11]|uniref:Ig-like domain-containing protein n=1 Tax=Azoarcus sp. DN11 TaxID=356837 RepID=UPI000FE1C5F4|nr:Ig-like domain-containing protein [Azoarcus sp. DN11]
MSLALLGSSAAHADLFQFGPPDVASGFPQWYQDNTGLPLDLCLPTGATVDPAVMGACLLVPPPSPPYVAFSNFPSELFYHRVVGNITMPGGKKAVLVLALEASFAPAGVPAAGQQVVFTRIRVTAGVPVAGTYTVTHPYGKEVFTDIQPGVGNRDILFTENVGNLAPGAFADALTSRVGPFLHAADSLGNPLPPVEIPLGSGQFFLSDAVATLPITGSLFKDAAGAAQNYFEICGPAGSDLGGPGNPCVRQTLFLVQGKVHQGAIASPLKVGAATYARAGTTAHVDAFASVKAAPAQAAPVLSLGAISLPPVLMTGPDVLGQYYGQGVPVPAGKIPATVTVTNSGDVPPSSVTQKVVDQVDISQASYDPTGHTLTVVASSSDKGNPAAVPSVAAPSLALEGMPATVVISATRPAPTASTDPASTQFVVTGLQVPPASVTVASAVGGSAKRGVAELQGPAFPPGAPFAVDDNVSTTSGVAVTMAPLANDVGVPAGATVTIVSQGANGTAAVTPTGQVTYTPTPAFAGADSFTYTVTSTLPTSNVATVNVTVVAPAGGLPPIANADAVTIQASAAPTTINVLANDSANGGVINPASVTIVTPPAAPATASVNTADGSVNFGSANTVGTYTFTYTVANKNTPPLVSAPATVTVNVVAPEVLAVLSAKCVNGTKAGTRWVVKGTSTISTGNVVTIFYLGNQVLGTVPVIAGAWALDLKGGPACSSPVSVQSSFGNMVANVPVAIQ